MKASDSSHAIVRQTYQLQEMTLQLMNVKCCAKSRWLSLLAHGRTVHLCFFVFKILDFQRFEHSRHIFRTLVFLESWALLACRGARARDILVRKLEV